MYVLCSDACLGEVALEAGYLDQDLVTPRGYLFLFGASTMFFSQSASGAVGSPF